MFLKRILKRIVHHTTRLCITLTLTLTLTLVTLATSATYSHAETQRYMIDTKGAHAFIQFKIKHLGYSWLMGRFNRFSGSFNLDEAQPENSSVNVTIETNSLDTNHAERDKHLRDKDFFDVKQFPQATFVSQSITLTSDKRAKITGLLTLKGISKPVVLNARYIGGGTDPWGGYRQGFEAATEIELKAFGFNYNLGPASEVVQIYISLEGIRQ